MTDHSATRPATVTTDDGAVLEAAWSGDARTARAVAILTHPHPAHGGDMHNLVPSSLARSLPAHGLATLRINFRGTGGSSGAHGGGEAEVRDVAAAADAAVEAYPGVPAVGIGYSFGADVLLALEDPRLAGVVAVAPPLAIADTDRLAAARGASPTLVLAAAHDQFRDPGSAAGVVADWPDARIEIIAGADHFMAGAVERVVEHTLAWLAEIIPPG